jgi:type IV pilus assembly protein PilM
MAKKKTVTLYIDDATLRLVVTKKDHVRTSAEEAIEPGLITGMVVNDPVKLAGQIGRMVKMQRVGARQIVVGISAINCLSRLIVLPALPRNLLGEAVVREARRLLPLPVEQLYLSFLAKPMRDGKLQVFMVAIRRVSIDSLLHAFRIARIRPLSLTIKPLALSRLARKDCILIDVQKADFDIVVLTDGLPSPLRTVAFPAVDLPWEAKIPIITEEIDRTMQFHAANNPEKPLPTDQPMYVAGELANQVEMHLRLTERFGFPVRTLESRLDFRSGREAVTFLVNGALRVEEKASLLMGDVSITSLNMLPDEHRIKTIKWDRVIVVPAATAALGIAVPLALMVASAMGNLNAAHGQLDVAGRLLQQKQSQKTEMNKTTKKLQTDLAAAKLSYGIAMRVMNTLTDHATMVDRDLQAIGQNLPQTATITHMQMSDGSVNVEGAAPDDATVLAYGRALENTGRFTSVIVLDIRDANQASGGVTTQGSAIPAGAASTGAKTFSLQLNK